MRVHAKNICVESRHGKICCCKDIKENVWFEPGTGQLPRDHRKPHLGIIVWAATCTLQCCHNPQQVCTYLDGSVYRGMFKGKSNCNRSYLQRRSCGHWAHHTSSFHPSKSTCSQRTASRSGTEPRLGSGTSPLAWLPPTSDPMEGTAFIQT